jgi:hypothetical protein
MFGNAGALFHGKRANSEDERVPKLPSGPGTIQSRSLSASQQGSQSTPVPSPSLRRQVFRATSSWPHLLHRSSILAWQKHAGGGAVSLSVMIETLPQEAS